MFNKMGLKLSDKLKKYIINVLLELYSRFKIRKSCKIDFIRRM